MHQQLLRVKDRVCDKNGTPVGTVTMIDGATAEVTLEGVASRRYISQIFLPQATGALAFRMLQFRDHMQTAKVAESAANLRDELAYKFLEGLYNVDGFMKVLKEQLPEGTFVNETRKRIMLRELLDECVKYTLSRTAAHG